MEVNPRYRKLFEPGRIGTMELKNRIVEAAMGTSLEREDGSTVSRISTRSGPKAVWGLS